MLISTSSRASLSCRDAHKCGTRSCLVWCRDLAGTDQAVDVAAESLYEVNLLGPRRSDPLTAQVSVTPRLHPVAITVGTALSQASVIVAARIGGRGTEIPVQQSVAP